MSLYRELLDALPFDPAEREGVWGYRRAEEPNAVRASLAVGVVVALALATGLGVASRLDWGAALFYGLAVAVFTRGVLLARYHLRHGAWRAWRRRRASDRAVDLASGGLGVALALVLASGAGGIGPAFPLGEALFAGILAAMFGRACCLIARWP